MSANSTPPALTALTLVESRAETPFLQYLRLDAPPDFLAAYTIPGQYVQTTLPGQKPAYFALAGGPSRSQIELLIKRGTPVADALASRQPGDKVELSHPMGRGYPVAQARGVDVLLVGVGSGLAPLRALLHELLRERAAYGRLRLIYGARQVCAFPFAPEMTAWERQGVDVVRVCSQPERPDWAGVTGRVQDALAGHALAANAAVFACGMKAMVQDVRALVERAGLAPERVYENY